MNKMILASTVALFALSGMAQAAELKNLDKETHKVTVSANGKQETITLKGDETYTTKGDASFIIGSEKPLSVKTDGKLVIKGGKIETAPAATAEKKVEKQLEKAAEQPAAPAEKLAPAAGASVGVKADVKAEQK